MSRLVVVFGFYSLPRLKNIIHHCTEVLKIREPIIGTYNQYKFLGNLFDFMLVL